MPNALSTIAGRLLTNGSISSISGRVPVETRMAEHDLTATAVAAAVVVGGRRMTIEDIVSIARRGAPVALNPDPAWRARIQRGAEFLRSHLAEGPTVYGVITGYGDAC